MDILTKENLEELISHTGEVCVSIFMPTHEMGRKTEQDPTRLKNLLKKAENDLAERDLRSPDIREMLKPAQKLLQDSFFWKYQSSGLALFISPDTFRSYRLPIPFQELVVASKNFHLKPLLPFFADDGHYYILALSQNQVRLFEGTRYTVDEVDLEDMPQSIADAFLFERFYRQSHIHTGTSPGSSGESTGMFHGHDPSDEDKSRILRWFQKIDDELPNLLIGKQSPVVLAGVEFLFPLFEEASSHLHFVEEKIPGNPEKLSPEELHKLSWPLVLPYFMQAQEKATAELNQLSDTEQTSADVREIVPAAHHGRVDVLFVSVSEQIWGNFNPGENRVYLHRDPLFSDRDLLDLAAIQTMLNGGIVYTLKPENMPQNSPIAAIFRY